MDAHYAIEQLDSHAWEEIGGALMAYNAQKAGDDNARRLCYVLKDDGGTILAGTIDVISWDWLSMDLMWVQEDLQSQGFGGRLLSLIENEARRLGARHVHLATFSFQAPLFYEKFGYTVFGQLADFSPGFQCYYLTKSLLFSL